MNGFARLSGALDALRMRKVSGAGGERDDHALARHMRSLAVRLSADGRARLRCPARLAAQIRALSDEAARMLLKTESATPALERLGQDARIMEAYAAQARMEGGARLSAAGRTPRVLTIMREAVAMGDTALSAERLKAAVSAFDEVQPLSMAEIWAIPTALRRALSEAFCINARAIVQRGRERCEAERFVERRAEKPRAAASCAFFERALHLSVERELPQVRAGLERRIAHTGNSVEKVIRLEHETQALLSMRLDNLIGAKRMLDALDWQKCFEALSQTEAELAADPDGTYPRMDDASRAAVRDQVSAIARRLRASEREVARQAARAAGEHSGTVRGTVCWWLYDDEGRAALARRMGAHARLPRLVPDPRGRGLIAAQALLSSALFALYAAISRSVWVLALGVPLSWCASMLLIGRVFTRLVRPRPLLKLRADALDASSRVLVVMPVLISSVERAAALCDGLETVGCLDRDENTSYLLLGDFRDGPQAEEADDVQILDAVRARIRAMNERAGREKFFYLHRRRAFYAPDRRWMGHERKRGALMALNRLLLEKQGARAAFDAEGEACSHLAGRFNLVVTLDADTRMPPGCVQALAGAMLHPLNRPRVENGARRGYAVLQPNMELAASACTNQFIRLFAGQGGMDAYPVSVSNVYQDLAGLGSFAGKGIYDVRAFMEAVEGKLPDGRVLSHDLIEGELARAAFVGDLSFFDGFPDTFSAYLKRLNRWTRGDWQLLPFLFRRGFSGVSRLKMLDNLLRSLAAPALLALLLQAMWLDLRSAFALGVLYAFLDPISRLFTARGAAWRRAVTALAALPSTAAAQFDAVARTLFRLAFTKSHMLDWVTSADAAAGGARVGTACRACAILCVPGLFRGAWIPAALSLMALFILAPGFLRDLQTADTDPRGALRVSQIGALTALARETWSFFEVYVTARENHLPPDNVQIDPDVGAARRTSPTNIGLYLIACLSARELGFLRDEQMLARMRDTLATLERMETWHGHLYNWYDIDTLRPLRPRYVSSVDSGNLAACLLTCAAAAQGLDAQLAGRMRALARGMDFVCLFDRERELFLIGADVENARLSASHYDLLASESRILSYVAMMLGQVSVRHWKRLARPTVRAQREQALVSWSGTMFEYLMPEIFMRSRAGTLLGQTGRAIARVQARLGASRGRPWGVSESGYYAFDMHLNYQYRAFGVRELALCGGVKQSVVAPYASVLALCVCPGAAADNVRLMRGKGWAGAHGFYEAADYTGVRRGEAPRLVKSYMAHHQGMSLAALANALAGDAISEWFEGIPEARALSLLLEEKPASRVRLQRRREHSAPEGARRPEEHGYRLARAENRLVDAHLIYGGGATAVLTARGCALFMREGVLGNRFFGDLLDARGDLRVRAWDARGGEAVCLNAGEARFDAGWAQYESDLSGLRACLTVALSPEDGTLFHHLRLENRCAQPREIVFEQAFPVALCTRDDCWAHPAFQNLFIAAEQIGMGAVLLRRRPGGRAQSPYALAAMVCGADATECETDRARYAGREGARARSLSGSLGCTLDPCCVQRARMRVEAGQRREMHFAVALIPPEEAGHWLERNASCAAAERARRLAATQARAMLGFIGLHVQAHHLLSRASALLLDARLAARGRFEGAQAPCGREALWALGLSGDRPVLTVTIAHRAALPIARDAVRAHEYYRTAGLETDLVFVNDYGNDYAQPVRDALKDMIASSHLREMTGAPGGVHVIDGAQLPAQRRAALMRASALCFDESTGFFAQLRAKLGVLEACARVPYREMEARSFKLPSIRRALFNGYGGFAEDGYAVDLGSPTPAAWSNILAGRNFGALVTERGGGFLFGKNSRFDRLTPFGNDPLCEGWGLMLYLVDERKGAYARLLPGERPFTPFRATHGFAESRFESGTSGVRFLTTLYARPDADALGVQVRLTNTSGGACEYSVVAFVDWLMGVDARDASLLRTWNEDGMCLSSGAAEGVGYLAPLDAPASAGAERAAFLGHGGLMRPDGLFAPWERRGGWALKARVSLAPGQEGRLHFAIGMAAGREEARAAVRAMRDAPDALQRAREEWQTTLPALQIVTGDEAIDRVLPMLVKQALDGRVRARTGLYQAGGAYGFRDQLQDMLALMHYDSALAREHILRAAARQFESGDVMHWWHMPYTGVRTRISDDRLFLPYVTAAYVRLTGDREILFERVAYLRQVQIPEGASDWYGTCQPGECVETLSEHCMRAFRLSASLTGEHGLALMGTGDWNDSMDRVGARGRGESVWLSEFLSVAAQRYAEIVPNEEDRAWLNALSAQMNAAVEEFGWDGAWYLRAYTDDGSSLGGALSQKCRIDALSQAWAAFAGLDMQRVSSALDAAWENLVDEERGIVKLLTPPFDGDSPDPGYIRAYPPGVRENGGQYTHGACWLTLAYIRTGQAERAQRIVSMLCPANHARTREQADRYRVEPYVIAADVYGEAPHAGRGGWTWYTGAASWYILCVLALLGYERQGDRVRLRALLGDRQEAQVILRYGKSVYRLVCRREARFPTLDGAPVAGEFIALVDDASEHLAVFPPRLPAQEKGPRAENNNIPNKFCC